jgi:hypothetical protein
MDDPLAVMRAPAGSVFRPDVSTPPGHAGPTGNVMSVIVNACTGQKEGLNLEPSPPGKLDELGPELHATVPAVGTASATSTSSRSDGVLAGSLLVHGRLTPGWRILVASGNSPLPRDPVAREKTSGSGRFRFSLAPGRYRIGALRPHDSMCGLKTIHVTRGEEIRLALKCS